MWDFSLTDFLLLLKETWLILLIGIGTAFVAFAAGLKTLRKGKSKAPKLAAAADPFAAVGTHERRTAIRRGGHPVTLDLHDPEELQPSQQGWVLDRSLSGLCLMVPNALPIGSFWKVRPCNAPQAMPLVRVEVKSCAPDGAEWKLGCRFEKTPNYAVLLMFG
ncbi:MAG TPA: hypothetical protein DDY78_20735 [Planctomycetales bacterium]|nr:hypothetical protein [Planctomycetales bacterium]